eukprot:1842957-Pyramimonas_sp.AAC.1
MQTASEFFEQKEECVSTIGFALLGTWPVDGLSHRIQHLDFESNSLTELTDCHEENKLNHCLQQYWALHNDWYDSAEGMYTRVVLSHMEANGVSFAARHDGLRKTTVSMAAGVWSRMALRRAFCITSN